MTKRKDELENKVSQDIELSNNEQMQNQYNEKYEEVDSNIDETRADENLPNDKQMENQDNEKSEEVDYNIDETKVDKDTALKETAIRIMEQKDISVSFVTSDGTVFDNYSYAKNHSENLDNKKVIKVER